VDDLFSPGTRGEMTMDPEFRERVREKYTHAMAQIEPMLDRTIVLAREQIGRSDDPVILREIQKTLEAVVALYIAECGPLNTGTTAWLMLKAITQTLRQYPECCDPAARH
jgi:hypothetical protein